jgi:hypothetical protein
VAGFEPSSAPSGHNDPRERSLAAGTPWPSGSQAVRKESQSFNLQFLDFLKRRFPFSRNGRTKAIQNEIVNGLFWSQLLGRSAACRKSGRPTVLLAVRRGEGSRDPTLNFQEVGCRRRSQSRGQHPLAWGEFKSPLSDVQKKRELVSPSFFNWRWQLGGLSSCMFASW